jgi:hypothetical protein
MTVGDDLIFASALESVLAAPPASEQLDVPMAPIRLTPSTPYLMGRAALVFASPHWLTPADDLAFFGPRSHEGNSLAPHLEVWFKVPKLDRTYNVEFLCAADNGSFTLTSSLPSATPISQPTNSGDTLITKNFVVCAAGSWVWFSVSNNFPWRFKSLEISERP